MTGAGTTGDELRARTWDDLATLTATYYGHPDARHRGDGWFASLSRQATAELNVCGLFGPAGPAAAEELLVACGDDLPVVVFAALGVDAARDVLVAAGFGAVTEPEAVMCLTHPPEAVSSEFRVEACSGPEQLTQALTLNAEAHAIPFELLAAATEPAYRSGRATAWLAYDGDDPVSTVSVCRHGPVLGVMEMMTPARHQRRGAGRALLAHVLRAEWDDALGRAVLFSSLAGQRLYESLGFQVTDTSVTSFRGLDDEVLQAIGQGI